jgi:ketosteroid isomerase-like protein
VTTTSSSTASLDVDAFGRAIEQRDVDGQLRHYADDAVIEIVDREHPPSEPQRISGREEIRAYLDDISGRDMTHTVRHALAGDDAAALWVDCRYPDGTRVKCAGAFVVRDGKVVRQDIVQEWDG